MATSAATRRPRPASSERLIQVIRAAAERGLMVDVSFARETVPNLNIDNYIKGITRAATLLSGGQPERVVRPAERAR